jgi:hypothetical protein
MATRGFEFAYMLDGSNATPVIRDFTLGAAAAHLPGDLMLMQADGYIDKVTTATTEVTCVIQERFAAADVTAGTTAAKAAIITRNQVWKCSMDATSTSFVVGNTKTIDTVDHNTISASDSTGGAMTLVETGTDNDGNVLAFVVFLDTTFGNT